VSQSPSGPSIKPAGRFITIRAAHSATVTNFVLGSKVPICPPRTFTATIQWVLEVVDDNGLTSHRIDEDDVEGAHRREGGAFSQSDAILGGVLFVPLVPCLNYERGHRACEVDGQPCMAGTRSHRLLPLSVGVPDLVPKSSEPLHNARGATEYASEYVGRVLARRDAARQSR
jgi:hypothetical protein